MVRRDGLGIFETLCLEDSSYCYYFSNHLLFMLVKETHIIKQWQGFFRLYVTEEGTYFREEYAVGDNCTATTYLVPLDKTEAENIIRNWI